MGETVLELKNIVKTFPGVLALNDVSFDLEKGEVHAICGENGAGKSTTMKMFLGLARPTAGAFTIAGMEYPKDRMEILRRTGSLIEEPAFYGNLSGRENLDIIRKILDLPKDSVEDALSLTGLSHAADRPARKYSLGMKQRLGLAGALIGRPKLLILDEPTNGLDPAGIHEIRTLIRSLPEKFGCTVLVSSHLLPEIELMADDIGILNHGRLLFEGSLEELRQDAALRGFPTDNLEETFLALIDEDNLKRRGLA